MTQPGNELTHLDFRQPADIVTDPRLDRASKVKLLRDWEYDAREMEVAEEEGMIAPTPDLLDDIMAALHALGDQDDNSTEAPPTKHGGD